MSSFQYLLLFGNILLILISWTKAGPLDGNCTINGDCDGSGAMICQGGKCQCDTPWYKPCNTRCDIQRYFVYEGAECRQDDNCVKNARCDNASKRCICQANFTAINGLCYKNLNSKCEQSIECWSGDCRDRVCKCPLGFVPRGDNSRCQIKLAKFYANWTYANASNDFCYGSLSSFGCLNSNGICQNDSQHAEMFCQCPPSYTANYDTQECKPTVYTGSLSPSSTPLPNDQCGTCQDVNAICLFVGNQTTCWCRSGFVNVNNQCKIKRQNFIFPNNDDINQRQYTSHYCWINQVENNRLCTCASGYKFVDKTSPCQPIQRILENNNFEYGVCTRINSYGQPVQENGLCPFPLTCQARQDKYVCSCGLNKYLDEKSNTCYYFLGRNLTAPDGSKCPPGSNLTGQICQCSPNGTYNVSNDQKRCELILTNKQVDNVCTNAITNDELCAKLYGGNTKFCTIGECRCISGRSYYNVSQCVTYLGVDPGTNVICPTNAYNNSNQCQCMVGYRAVGNLTCELKVKVLFDSSNPPTQNSASDVTTEDCKALFLNGYVKAYNNACMCIEGTFSNGITCVFFLTYSPLPTDGSTIYCPNLASNNSTMCKCDSGYKNHGDNRSCDRITDTVYDYNDSNGTNIAGLRYSDCIALFGYATEEIPDDSYCRCANSSVAFRNQNKCYFLVETSQTTNISARDCPPNSEIVGNKCKCLQGFTASLSNQSCEQKISSNLQSIDINAYTSCNAPYTDGDCESLYGVGAVCRNNTCYCDRSQSFVLNNRCVLFSKYVFPGSHERHSVTCNLQEDCGTDSDQNGIECGFINENEMYKVCKCKQGYFLNPINSTCVKQCQRPCSDSEECQGYQCICKDGYYRNSSGQCVLIDISLKLHDTCNVTFWTGLTPANGELQCSLSCERVECILGYHDDGSKCVKYNFDDRCAHDESICTQLSPNSICYRDENKCTCEPGYYRTQGEIICARAVNNPCEIDSDCGDLGQCLSRQCKCKPGQKEVPMLDFLGRQITGCINGVDQIRFSPVLLLFFVLIHVFFI